MCNILILPAGQMPIYSEFENMCWNNWHSYGLVTKVNNKLDIKRKIFPDDSLSLQDIKDLYQLLKDDLEHERILHVRHITAGANSEENCHPLPAYYSDKREVVFMHNGTLYDWQTKKQSTVGNVTSYTVDYDGASDSKNFCDKVIQPMLAASDFGNGHGDITSAYAKMIFNKLWGADNRGILISSDQPTLYLGLWSKCKSTTGSDIKSANDKYFDDVIRGPEKTRREESLKKRSDNNVISISQIKDLNKLGKVDPEKYRIKITGFEDISNDWNLYDYEGLSSLGNLTNDELDILFEEHPVDAQLLFDLVTSSHQKLWEEYQALKIQVAG